MCVKQRQVVITRLVVYCPVIGTNFGVCWLLTSNQLAFSWLMMSEQLAILLFNMRSQLEFDCSLHQPHRFTAGYYYQLACLKQVHGKRLTALMITTKKVPLTPNVKISEWKSWRFRTEKAEISTNLYSTSCVQKWSEHNVELLRFGVSNHMSIRSLYKNCALFVARKEGFYVRVPALNEISVWYTCV